MSDDETKSQRIDLGLDVLQALAEPNRQYSCAEIAAWCDCAIQNIHRIEQRAIRKLRRKLRKIGIEPQALDVASGEPSGVDVSGDRLGRIA